MPFLVFANGLCASEFPPQADTVVIVYVFWKGLIFWINEPNKTAGIASDDFVGIWRRLLE